jgi:hypothetical protein
MFPIVNATSARELDQLNGFERTGPTARALFHAGQGVEIETAALSSSDPVWAHLVDRSSSPGRASLE